MFHRQRRNRFEPKPRGGFNTLTEYTNFKKNALPYLAILIIIGGLGITIIQIQQIQELRGRAEYENLNNTASPSATFLP